MGEPIESPPPYKGYPPAGPPPGPTVTTVVPGAVIIQQSMGPKPSHVTCQSCNNETTTRIKWKATTRTHLFAGLLCLLGCWPCVCVPYCIESTRNADHYCSNCDAFIGSYIR